jgi:hypothetical protein
MAAGVVSRSFPWILVHIAAIPLAVGEVGRGRDASSALLAALYLGWLGQALILQHPFDYVYLPAMVLAFAVVMGWAARLPHPRPGRLFAVFLMACIFIRAPILLGDRLSVWPQCWVDGSSMEIRDRSSRFPKLNWRELEEVADYLRKRDLKDGELTCFNMPTAALLRELDVEAATRYHFFQNNWLTFRHHRDRINGDLAASRQRFVVVDLLWEGVKLKEPDLDLLPPRWVRWKPRIVFQSGRYIVLQLSGTETPAWLEECFE